MSEGRWDDAERALMRVLETQPGDLDARARLHQVRVERMHVAVRQANAQRAIELQSTLDQGKRTLPESLQLSSPEVALADVLGPAESGDAMVVDLRGSTSAVVDPLFFRTRSDGTPMRRFADFGAPGQPISRFAFADSRYDGALSVAWMPTMRELLTQPGDLHRQREALLTSLADLPVLPMTLLSVDHGRQLEASRVKVAAAYETYLADRNQRLAQAATASLNAGLQMIAGMEQEGWLKPGDDLVKTIDGDPLLKAEFENRCRVVRVYAEMYLDAAEDAAYREMARNVTAIMRQGTSP